ncbi:AAA family ATPase [Sulfuricurvum sp.]|uniref:AAA family ATPase n=1 Tax=Sulfuricurvum sp. TaxID=2025608 RepID=UPI00260F5409|nr:AAA family ATPase [Sulfuricurvum sp.]MDD3597729.1 AAA family ATPase [Sulfuricurvum sp.]
MKIDAISINNYKSIKEIKDLKLTNLNILIGSNGAGKSNFISFFKLLNMIIEKRLREYTKTIGADNILHFGKKNSEEVYGKIDFGMNKYSFTLKPTEDDTLFFANERTHYLSWRYDNAERIAIIGTSNDETKLFECSTVCEYVRNSLLSWRVYHFHDTSSTAGVKKYCGISENKKLSPDASNLAAFLYLLMHKYSDSFFMIEETVKLIAPYFDRFILEPDALNEERIRLEWMELGSDKVFNANHLSDGTLRMICLTTLLLQPNPPDTIIIDEPELGLHPYAITVLAALMKSFATSKQLIVSTQSVTLINHFESQNIIVTDKSNGASNFRRLEIDELKDWIEEYSLGEIWEKNIIGGTP